MATQEQIFSVRLKISDPPGFIAFDSVENAMALPEIPASQTAYLQEDTGEYKATEKPSSASASDYEVQPLSLSDASIGAYIDQYGFDGAVCQSIKQAIGKLGSEMRIKSLSGGADTTEYQALSDTMAYYKDLLALCTSEKSEAAGTNTGRYFTTKQPEIGGGNL